MKCPNCQTENREGAEFCRKCGQSLQAEITCPQCGHENPQGIKFCYEYGYSLAEPSLPIPPPIPPLPEPTSFANNQYQVKKKLGEGGKKSHAISCSPQGG